MESGGPRTRDLQAAFAWGAALRIAYALATPVALRAHDLTAHLRYVAWAGKTFRIPHWSGGSEFFQPPLYYDLAGLVVRAGAALHLGSVQVVAGLQALSTLLSLAALAGALWAGFELFPGGGPARLVYAFLVASFPEPVIDFAGRINNDVLLAALTFPAVALLQRWWRTGSETAFRWLAILLAIGLLTKSSAAVVAACAGGLILLRPAEPFRARVIRTVKLGIVLALLGGWFYALRLAQGQRDVYGTVSYLPDSLRASNRVAAYTTFSPAALLAEPFNDPYPPNPRRDLFWEFLSRSTLFGEHAFGSETAPFARILVASAFLLAGLAAAGAVASRRSGEAVPMFLLAALSLAASLALRIHIPYTCNQNVRLVPWLAIPAAFLAARGTEGRGAPWRRAAALLFVLASAAFFVAVIASES